MNNPNTKSSSWAANNTKNTLFIALLDRCLGIDYCAGNIRH